MKEEYTTIVALLHDVVEDTDYSLDDLIAEGFPVEVTDAISLLTHEKNEPYLDYVKRIKENPIASAVKITDLRHNSDLSRLDAVDDKALCRVEKYKKAIELLTEAKTEV
jgi:molybdopterin-guanine dinucleotide biosynthesis protein